MSQQSNPATLREALSEARKVIVIACGDKAPYVKVALARIDAALAASGTEAAPVCNLCHHSLVDNNHGFDQNDASMDGDKLVHSGYCTYCKLCQAQRAQVAASPEGREAPLYTGELAAIDEELDEILGKRAADDVTSVLTRVHNALLRQSAAPSGGAALLNQFIGYISVEYRWEQERWENCQALAKQFLTGAVTETK